MTQSLKRVSLLLREQQYQKLNDKGLNVSGLVRDLLDDFLSEHKITINVTENTKQLYDTIISNTGSTDEDLEKYLRTSLKELLSDKIKAMQKLEQGLSKK